MAKNIYRIQVKEHLDFARSEWFGGLKLVQNQDGTTTIVGEGIDQAGLHGILNLISDMGLTLLSVARVEDTKGG